MPQLLFVMVGGAVGAGLRYELGRYLLRMFGPGFPWGTLAVNLIGGFLMGVLTVFLFGQTMADRPLWLLLGVGCLGGFTTFSAFSFDMFAMIERGALGTALGYAALSVLASFALLYLGFWLTRLVQ